MRPFRNVFLGVINAPFFIPGCFILFLTLRASVVIALPITMESDAGWYLARGLGIAAGQGYTEEGVPTAFWPIGYPGFLGVIFTLFGAHQIVGQIANILLSSASFFLVWCLTSEIFCRETTARTAVLLLTMYPNNIAYNTVLLSEIFLTFLLLLGIYLLIRNGSWITTTLAGIVFGLVTLTKPQLVFVPGLLVLLYVVAGKDGCRMSYHIMRGAIVYIAMVCVVAPWTIRNTEAFGEVIPISTNGGLNLLIGNNPSARGGYSPHDPMVPHPSVRSQVALDKQARGLALDWIRRNPVRFLELIPLKIFRLWAPDGEAEIAFQAGYSKYNENRAVFRAVRYLNQAYYALLMVLAAIALFQVRRHSTEVTWPGVLYGYAITIYLTVVSIVFFGESRFHFPAMPLLIMYAAWSATLLIEREHANG